MLSLELALRELATIQTSQINTDSMMAMHNEYFKGYFLSDASNIVVWEERSDGLYDYPKLILPDQLTDDMSLELIGTHFNFILLHPQKSSDQRRRLQRHWKGTLKII